MSYQVDFLYGTLSLRSLNLNFLANFPHVDRPNQSNFFFVRDGILSVADYNLTRVGVVVVVVVVVVVYFFTMG